MTMQIADVCNILNPRSVLALVLASTQKMPQKLEWHQRCNRKGGTSYPTIGYSAQGLTVLDPSERSPGKFGFWRALPVLTVRSISGFSEGIVVPSAGEFRVFLCNNLYPWNLDLHDAERCSICCGLHESGLRKDHHGQNADQQAICMDSQWTTYIVRLLDALHRLQLFYPSACKASHRFHLSEMQTYTSLGNLPLVLAYS